MPESGIARLEFEAFETTVMLPLIVPADVGLNTVLNVKLCPGVSVMGGVNPDTLNPVPETLA